MVVGALAIDSRTRSSPSEIEGYGARIERYQPALKEWGAADRRGVTNRRPPFAVFGGSDTFSGWVVLLFRRPEALNPAPDARRLRTVLFGAILIAAAC